MSVQSNINYNIQSRYSRARISINQSGCSIARISIDQTYEPKIQVGIENLILRNFQLFKL